MSLRVAILEAVKSPSSPRPRIRSLHLTDAILLFRRLGVDVHSLAAHEFTLAYFRLAKKYHPDRGNRHSCGGSGFLDSGIS